ncbi:MAG: hypothetical protein QOG31_369 [Thermoplasmata archaeon]|nr:hypothetical protein [Thermoplasmata archaeon]
MTLPALLALLCLPAVAAAPPGPPPMNLHAEPRAEGTAILTWDPPLGAGDGITYSVYADGTLLASIAATSYTVPVGAPVVYSVTATDAGVESAPIVIVVAVQPLAPDAPGLHCPPFATNVYTYYPFVAIRFYPECLPIRP